MSRNPSANLDNKVYVGDLGNNASKGELEDAFSYYGRLRSVWVARNPPGFAFIEFEDARDAEDAVRGLDGRTVCGRRCRVELSTGRTRSRGYSGPSRRGRPFHPEDRCYECGSRGHYARDCPLYARGRRRGSRSNSRSRSRSRSRNRSRSRSTSRRSRSPASRSKNRSRSRSTSRHSRRSRSTSRHSRRTRSPTRSKSKSISRRSASKSDRSQSRGRSRDRSHSRDRSRDVSRDRSLSASRSRSRSSKRSVSPRANGDD